MFVTQLERVAGEYVVKVPHAVVVQQDLRDGQIVSVTVEPLTEYAHVDAETAKPAETRWRLNEDTTAYREGE